MHQPRPAVRASKEKEPQAGGCENERSPSDPFPAKGQTRSGLARIRLGRPRALRGVKQRATGPEHLAVPACRHQSVRVRLWTATSGHACPTPDSVIVDQAQGRNGRPVRVPKTMCRNWHRGRACLLPKPV
jgi:hypothetical protein